MCQGRQARGVEVEEERVGVGLGEGVVERAEPAGGEADAADHERVVGEGEERLQGVQRGEVVVDDAGEQVRGGERGGGWAVV